MPPAFRAAAGFLCILPAIGPGAPPAGARQSDAIPAQAAEEPPAPVRLGARLALYRAGIPVRPTVVIVPDADSYVRAISMWKPGERFPVLVDDGSAAARDNIARFIRAFEPQNVLLLPAKEPPPGQPPDAEGKDDDEAAGPDGAPARAQRRRADPDPGFRARIERAALGAWGAESHDELAPALRERRAAPAGVVVASATDPAWTAALALAAARAQPIIWTDVRAGRTEGFLRPESLETLGREISAALAALPYTWAALGDDIEGVTLCVNLPARIRPENSDPLALTDEIGRDGAGVRFAWCGMITGDEAAAAYRAMCSIFLQPRSAWLFDGYAADFAPPFSARPAAELFERAGFSVTHDGPPGNSAGDFRRRALAPPDAGLIFVNTKGHSRWFELNPGRAFGSDAPILRRPAAVYFVHSFSAERLGDPANIATRWLDHGAFAYVGSVHEPTIAAFVPPQALAARLLSGWPLGPAARTDNNAGRKINILGDPLFALGQPATRTDEPLAIDDAVALDEAMRTAAKAHRLADAVAYLIWLDREEDALRLAGAALDKPGPDNGDVADTALAAAFHAGDPALFTRLYLALPFDRASDAGRRAMLWQLMRGAIARGRADSTAVALLRVHVRDESAGEDASLILPLVERLHGREQAHSLVGGLMTRDSVPDDQKRILQRLSQR